MQAGADKLDKLTGYLLHATGTDHGSNTSSKAGGEDTSGQKESLVELLEGRSCTGPTCPWEHESADYILSTTDDDDDGNGLPQFLTAPRRTALARARRLNSDKILHEDETISPNGLDSAARRQHYAKYSGAPIMNLLDHGGIITKKQGICGFGSGLVSAIQGFLMATLFGWLLAAMGAGTAVINLAQSLLGDNANQLVDPLMDAAENAISKSEKRGISREDLQETLLKKAVTDSAYSRIKKYALFSLLGRGGGSFWLTAISAGITVLSIGDIPNMIAGATNTMMMGKQAFNIIREDILTYRFLHHPEVVASRINDLTADYAEQTRGADRKLIQEISRELVQGRAMGVDGLMSDIMDVLGPGRDDDKQMVNHLFGALADILESRQPDKEEEERHAPPPEIEAMFGRFAQNVFG